MSATVTSKKVQDYFESQPIQTKKAILELRQYILNVVPNATELFNYNIPAYALIEGGKSEH